MLQFSAELQFSADIYTFISSFHLEKWLSNIECLTPKYPTIPYCTMSRNGFKSDCYITFNNYKKKYIDICDKFFIYISAKRVY